MRFMNELTINREKNSDLALSEIVRFLWHGTRATDPKTIIQQEIGLNVNFARQGGAYGAGIYFADNAAYSQNYAYHEGNRGRMQLLLCCVIVGDSYYAPHSQQFTVPPNR